MNQPDINELLEKIKRKEAVIPGIWDPVFKSVMMNCRNYLTDIIHQVTKIPKNYIEKHLVIKNTEHPINRVQEKRGTSDLIVEIKENHIILEMNAFYYSGLVDKNLSYVEKLSIHNMKTGEDYPRKDKIIEINFDLERNKLFPESNKIIHEFCFMETEEHFIYSNHLTIYHIDLEKIWKRYYNKEKGMNRFEKEMLLLMITDIKELIILSRGDDTMEEAKKQLTDLSDSYELFTEYEREEMRKKEEAAIARYRLEQATEEGMKKGLEQGLQQGLEQGIEQGIEQGKKLAQQELIQKLKDQGIDPEIIKKLEE